jgi:hypothetical protein
MTQLVKHGPSYDNFFFIGRSRTVDEIFVKRARSPGEKEVVVWWPMFYRMWHSARTEVRGTERNTSVQAEYRIHV